MTYDIEAARERQRQFELKRTQVEIDGQNTWIRMLSTQLDKLSVKVDLMSWSIFFIGLVQFLTILAWIFK